MKTTQWQRHAAPSRFLRRLGSLVALVILLSASTSAGANPIGDAAAELESGRLRFLFPAREGVSGNGHSVSINSGSRTVWRNGRDPSRRSWCDVCDIEVTLTLRESEIRRLRWRINGRSQQQRDDLTDLGVLEAVVARDFLMEIIEDDDSDDQVAEEALEAAVLSEAMVPWRQLLTLARDDDKGHSLRKTSLFWLGQEAQESVTQELEGVVVDELQDLEVRKAALFALSQRPEEESIPSLQRIALQHRDMQLRRDALFWLAQMDTPEVVDFFEEILTDAERR